MALVLTFQRRHSRTNERTSGIRTWSHRWRMNAHMLVSISKFNDIRIHLVYQTTFQCGFSQTFLVTKQMLRRTNKKTQTNDWTPTKVLLSKTFRPTWPLRIGSMCRPQAWIWPVNKATNTRANRLVTPTICSSTLNIRNKVQSNLCGRRVSNKHRKPIWLMLMPHKLHLLQQLIRSIKKSQPCLKLSIALINRKIKR